MLIILGFLSFEASLKCWPTASVSEYFTCVLIFFFLISFAPRVDSTGSKISEMWSDAALRHLPVMPSMASQCCHDVLIGNPGKYKPSLSCMSDLRQPETTSVQRSQRPPEGRKSGNGEDQAHPPIWFTCSAATVGSVQGWWWMCFL